MLILAHGRCEVCGESFGQTDLLQSLQVECADCRRIHTLCRTCQDEGCRSCSGRLLNAWEQVERDLPGQGIIF
jgi:hypothetical protein